MYLICSPPMYLHYCLLQGLWIVQFQVIQKILFQSAARPCIPELKRPSTNQKEKTVLLHARGGERDDDRGRA